jgi:FkbM family methyltransferase
VVASDVTPSQEWVAEPMNLAQMLKDALVGLGPSNTLTQTAVRIALRKRGFRIGFRRSSIALTKDRQTILMRSEDLTLLPVMAEMHRHFFQVLQPDQSGVEETLDFSKAGTHKYRRTGFELLAPTIPEDDSMPDYTRKFVPRKGTVVFDIGAHAGLTTIELAQMVGGAGHVYAFEPDSEARGYLLKNLERSNTGNVSVLDFAVGEHSGEALFCMDGTQAAGLLDFVVYPKRNKVRTVQVLTLEDACRRAGTVPHFIKSDIEGGELGMIRGSIDFLRTNPVHMAFETHRLRDGSFTHQYLQPLLSSAGYLVESYIPEIARQHFLYATPVQGNCVDSLTSKPQCT